MGLGLNIFPYEILMLLTCFHIHIAVHPISDTRWCTIKFKNLILKTLKIQSAKKKNQNKRDWQVLITWDLNILQVLVSPGLLTEPDFE